MTSRQDRLYAINHLSKKDFCFDEQVVRVFPDMIVRSVPGYELIVPLIGLLARRYAQAGSRIYDLGCSLGAVSQAMSQAIRSDAASIIAMDNSEAMVKHCRQLLSKHQGQTPVEVLLQDITQATIEDASVVVLNFTLQFLDRGMRQSLINRIAAGMRSGAALIVSEKICFTDQTEQQQQTAWHHDFKRSQGYSELEVAQKRDALEAVLLPDTEATHFERFRQAGLGGSRRWFQCFNFASYITFR